MENNTYNFFKQTLKGGAMYGFWGTIVKILVVINIFFILKYLTIYQYGVYKLAFSLFAVMSGFLLSGINGIVLNDVSNYLSRKDRPSVRRLLYEFSLLRIFLGILAWSILFFGAQVVAVYYNVNVANYIKILSFLYLTDSIITILDVFFRATLNFFMAAIIPALVEINKFIIIIYFVYFSVDKLNIERILWASVVSSAVACVIILAYFVLKYRNKLSIPMVDKYILFKNIKTYGKWAIVKSYFNNIPKNLRLWLIKFFISTEAVAIFSVAETLFTAVKKLIPLQALSSIIPKQIKDFRKLADIYKKGTKYSMILFLLVGILSYFLVPLAVKIIFPKYVVSLPYFKVLLLILCFKFFVFTKPIIYSLRRYKFLFLEPFIKTALVLFLGILLIPRFSLYGVIIEYVLTSLTIPLIFYFYLIKQIPQLKLSFRNFYKFDNNDKIIIKTLWLDSKNYFKKKILLN